MTFVDFDICQIVFHDADLLLKIKKFETLISLKRLELVQKFTGRLLQML